MIELKVTDKYELQAVHKALMEAKFHSNPDQPIVQGSPMVARFMNHIVDELEKINWATTADKKFKNIDFKNEWPDWRSNPGENIVVPCLANHLEAIEKMVLESQEKADEFLDVILSPYKVSEERKSELLKLAKEKT